MPIKLVNGYIPLKERYRMYVINQHNIAAGGPDDYWAFWKFDNNLNDESANAFNLSTQNGGTPPGISYENGRKGDANGSIRFQNTISNYTYVFKLLALRKSFSSGFTLSAWIKVNTKVPNSNAPIELDYGAGLSHQVVTKYPWSTPANYAQYSSGQVYVNVMAETSLGTTWRHHFVTVTSDGTTNYWIDNVQVVTDANLGNPTAYKMQFGWGTGGAPFNGNLDDVKFYERILTADEKTALYNE